MEDEIMTNDRKKPRGEPAVEFHWDPLQLASDKTFSTTIRIEVSGWWPEGRPERVAVSVYQGGQEPPSGNSVRIQKGHGTFPLTRLEPGRHYYVVVYIEDRLPVQNMITVPELPKPKKPTCDEKKIVDLKTKTDRVKAEKELKEVEQSLKKAEPPESRRQIKVLHSYRRASKLEVVLQRLGKDVKPEDGAISVLDFEQGGLVFGDLPDDFPFRKKEWGMFVVFLPYFEYPRQAMFFLPDDPDAKVLVDVPARVEHVETQKDEPVSPASPFQRGREVARQLFKK
ncbi:MAG: hypothetical protein A2913_00780 [Parcubacteria group bacterium RIFCSPLOWO2_01_FULL_40_65]|nr:MAG: hypothetical protein A2913_00780 [Parcubacteria group bacterium RIFCSPLOWO2_01_FULL_40_65]OHB23910.1 MAG: hypothetical protein A3F96_01650 [Parcubacteria group bacterium RIFCSPLOWO2_12_FULL_40_10]